ncbi:hypothetical protein C8R45DRAFT_971717 [Mycena sanguinolenta]|nr:hypothetical protein C8R45DRAFT_971717 [Mycena sanguinolenta]
MVPFAFAWLVASVSYAHPSSTTCHRTTWPNHGIALSSPHRNISLSHLHVCNFKLFTGYIPTVSALDRCVSHSKRRVIRTEKAPHASIYIVFFIHVAKVNSMRRVITL